MKKIEAIVRVEKLDVVRRALEKSGYPGMTILTVEGHGKQKGLVQQFRGREYKVDLLPKIKIEIVAKDEEVERILITIMEVARTGEIGDGKIFVSSVHQALRIRTGERGESAL
jgi:nitrogen regulatory protein P-II 1